MRTEICISAVLVQDFRFFYLPAGLGDGLFCRHRRGWYTWLDYDAYASRVLLRGLLTAA